MSAPQPCDRAEPHGPHFWRTFGATPTIVSCPGSDPDDPDEPSVQFPECEGCGARPGQAHDPVCTRSTGHEFDWTPETLHIGDMAAVIMKLHLSESSNASFAYRSAIVLWETLTGLPEAEALTFAYQIGSAHPPVTAVVPPF